jgi:hypothetical protein
VSLEPIGYFRLGVVEDSVHMAMQKLLYDELSEIIEDAGS